MREIQNITIPDDDDGQRLDRWLKKQLPKVPFALIQKMVRTGQVRINGKRAKTDSRILCGDIIRIPPVETKTIGPSAFVGHHNDETTLKNMTLYDDGEILVLNKPYGLPVQGGPNITRHIDGMLGALINRKGVKPRLIHRLDRDTSGLLICARSLKTTQALGKLFESRDIKKIYYALVSPIPSESKGTLRGGIIKGTGARKEAVVIDNVNGKESVTDYRVIASNIEKNIAWVGFWPRTGRMHQIRVHTADILKCSILGDEKYNGLFSFMDEWNLSHRLHLHATHLIFRHPFEDKLLKLTAPLPDDMIKSFKFCGFDLNSLPDPFDPKMN
jgi:23S rRNA pseudouridine955/2504/2580 synthase